MGGAAAATSADSTRAGGTAGDTLRGREATAEGSGWSAGDGSAEPWQEGRRTGARDGSADPRQSRAADFATGADDLDELGDEIARMAAHMHAFQRRYLARVAEFDRREGWVTGGHRSCAHWLSYRTGYDLRTARSHVRVARALEGLARTRTSMARGRLSFSQVRALTRVATPETEADLLALAEGCTAATLERKIRAWKKCPREKERDRERERHRSRRLAVFPDDDGMYRIRGRLTPEVGAVLLRALEAAEDALFRREATGEETGRSAGDGSAEPPAPEPPRREAARRRADAMGLLAERALAAGFGGEEPGDGDVPISGSRAERYQMFVHVDGETLRADGRGGRSELEDGTRLAAATARRLACDAAIVQVNRGPEGEVLNVGRRTRTIPPALRRALEVRDRGCRFPGCGLRFTDAHHVTHWADGGETSLENTVLLCRFHHRLMHEEGWTMEWWGKTRAVFRDPRGGRHLDERPPVPDPTATGDPVESLVRENRRHGADPSPLAASARWERERDVPDEVWFRATEAGIAGAGARPTAAAAPP